MIGLGVGVGRRKKRSVIIGGGGGGLLPLGSLITFFGDGVNSEGAAPGVRCWPAWALAYMGGRLYPSEGWMQCKSGGDMDTIYARRLAATKQAPHIFVFGSQGHNDGLISSSYATFMVKWLRNLDDAIAALPATAKIVVMTTLPSGVAGESTGGDWRATVRAAQQAEVAARQTLYGAGRILLFDTYAAVNGAGPYDYTVHSNASDNYVHPNALGGEVLGRMFFETVKNLIAPASKEDILADTTAKPWRGANIYAERLLTGTTGAKSGTIAPTGNVATTHTLANNLTNGAGVAVTAAKVAQAGYDQQQIDVTGTPAATQTVRFNRSANMTVTGGTPGKYFALIAGVKIDNGAGGAVPGMNNFGFTFGQNSLFSSADLAAFGFTNFPAFDGVMVVPPKPYSAADTATGQFIVDHRFAAAAITERTVIERPQVFELYTEARTAPWYFGDDTILSGGSTIRLTGTGVTGSGYPTAGTIAAATVATIRLDPGAWSGGGLTFSRVLKKNGVTVAGALASGWTYVMGGTVAAADVITVELTATNAFGAETRTLTFNVV